MGARDQFADAAHAAYAAMLREYLAPPLSLLCSTWADRFREIVKGPEKGRWRTSRTPYLREPMDCTDPEHPAQKVVMQFATQLGKSEVLYNAIFKRIQLAPQDMMLVQPTLQDSKDHSRQRFAPTARAMPLVNARLPRAGSRDETNTWQTKEIAGGASLFFSGANSARSLASKPLGFVGCDEIDGYPLDVDGEGDPLLLVWQRMSNFPDRKLLLCSTPTIKDFSRIEAEYLASDRRRYWVPCPHCGERQVLVWGADVEYGIKWLKTAGGAARPDTAVYVCRHCAAAIQNAAKTGMLAEGAWLAEAPGAQDGLVAGFHLSKLYSPVGWMSWQMLVADWLKAREAQTAGDTSKLKTFVNTSLAETWEDDGDRADESALRRRADDSPLRLVRRGLFVATLGVDVQGDRIEAYVWAWGRGMERQLVDRLVIYGDPALPETEDGSPWAALTEYRRTPILQVSGRPVPLLACMIDSGGHHTHAVYTYARAHQHAGVHACKGASQAGKTIIGKPSVQDVNWRGNRIKNGVKLWPIGTDTAKAEIYSHLRLTQPGPGYVHMSRRLPEEVFEQITAELLVTRYVKGHPRMEWVKPAGKRNEALDCAVYALAGAHMLNIDRWREGDWSKWERRVQTPELFDLPPGDELAPGAAQQTSESMPPVVAPSPPPAAGAQPPAATVPEPPADTADTYLQRIARLRAARR